VKSDKRLIVEVIGGGNGGPHEPRPPAFISGIFLGPAPPTFHFRILPTYRWFM